MEGLLAIPSGGGSGPVSPDAWETDSRENPVEIAAGGDELQRTIHSGDRDWFVIRPAENALYILETSGSLDTMMELYEGSRRLAENDDGGRGDNALISYPLEAGKIYTVMIRGYGSDTGSYGFSVRTQEIPDRDREPNDSRGQATAVEPESVTEGFIAPGDQDWYRFTLTEETSMIIRTRGRLDTLLALESAEAVLARDDDSGEGENARIIRKLGSGTYYVQVRGYDRNTSGPYTLELLVRSGASGADSWENDNAIEEAKPIALGETRRHTFTDGDDEDWAVFTAAEAGYYRISARGETDIDLDTELRLYFEDGGLVSEDDDGGEGYSSLIRRRLAPGRYYIRVSCLDDEPSDAYLLTVERE
jgi:hypothetical protein